MELINEILKSESLIRFPDCDPFNHLNNSRYIDYFINAREDHLRERYHFNIYGHAAKTGKSWFVSQNQIAYLRPANLMETVIIQSSILRWDANSVLVELQMLEKMTNAVKSLLWALFVHVDLKTGKREDHAEELHQKFNAPQSINPLPTFEKRVAELKTMKTKN